MTTQRYPDGTVATHPACLDDTPPRAAVDVMARIAAKTGLPDPTDELARLRFADSAASFIPAVHGADPVAVAGARVAEFYDRARVKQSPDFWAAIENLKRVTEQNGGAA